MIAFPSHEVVLLAPVDRDIAARADLAGRGERLPRSGTVRSIGDLMSELLAAYQLQGDASPAAAAALPIGPAAARDGAVEPCGAYGAPADRARPRESQTWSQTAESFAAEPSAVALAY